MLSLPNIKFSITLFCIVLIAGCSKNFKHATDSVEAAIAFNQKVDITPEYIMSVPYASSLVTVNDNFQVFMVLAFADKKTSQNTTQLTWMSKDKESIVTENGRIIHTTGFYHNNLEALSSPKNQLSPPGSTKNWHAFYDWSPGYRYHFSADVHTQSFGKSDLITPYWTKTAEHLHEKVKFNALENSFINQFWVIPETKSTMAYTIKTIQYLGPKMDKVEMLITKPFIELKSDFNQTAGTGL